MHTDWQILQKMIKSCLPSVEGLYPCIFFPWRLFAVDTLGCCLEHCQLHSHFTPFPTVQQSFIVLSFPVVLLSLLFALCSVISLIHSLASSHTKKHSPQHLSSPFQRKHWSDMIVSPAIYTTLLCVLLSVNYLISLYSVLWNGLQSRIPY